MGATFRNVITHKSRNKRSHVGETDRQAGRHMRKEFDTITDKQIRVSMIKNVRMNVLNSTYGWVCI